MRGRQNESSGSLLSSESRLSSRTGSLAAAPSPEIAATLTGAPRKLRASQGERPRTKYATPVRLRDSVRGRTAYSNTALLAQRSKVLVSRSNDDPEKLCPECDLRINGASISGAVGGGGKSMRSMRLRSPPKRVTGSDGNPPKLRFDPVCCLFFKSLFRFLGAERGRDEGELRSDERGRAQHGRNRTAAPRGRGA